MDGKKVYQIEINGIKESVNAVESLNKQLSELENRIKALEKSSVKINTSSSGGGTSSSKGSSSGLSEEQKLARQIEQIDAKRVAYSKEIYQNYLAAKDVLSETVSDQKQLAAAERLQADAYSNTMNGIKQKLADLKTMHFTTDISSDEFKEQTAEINTLTKKLKELEEAYGQYGRNVGNYADGVAQGMKNVSESMKDANKETFDAMRKVTVNIAGMNVEFENLEQAAGDMEDALKAMHREGKQGTQEYKDMAEAVHKLQGELKAADAEFERLRTASPALTKMLQTMESFTAIGQVGQGFSTLFGLDNTELEQQIAKLVALQNVLQGIQTISEQIGNKQGIGGWLAKGNDAIDNGTKKLLAYNKALLGTGTAAKVASKGIKLFSATLKGIATAGIVVVIDLLMDAFTAIVEEFKNFRDGGYKAGNATDYLVSTLEAANKQSEALMKTLKGKYLKGLITEEEYAAESTKLLSDELMHLRIEYVKLQDVFKRGLDVIVPRQREGESQNETLERLKMEFQEISKELDKFENRANGFQKFTSKFSSGVIGELLWGKQPINETKKEFQEIGRALSEDLIGRMEDAQDAVKNESDGFKNLGNVSEETKQKISELANEMKYGMTTNALIAQIDKFDKKGQYSIKVMQAMIDKFLELSNKIRQPSFDVDEGKYAQMEIDAMKDGLDKQRAQIELNRKKELAEVGADEKAKLLINKKYNRERIEAEKAYGKEYKQALADLALIRIELMEEGWAKEKKQLEHERDERIRAVEDSEILVGERRNAIRELYNKKIAKAEKERQEEQLATYRDFIAEINMLNRESFGIEVQNAMQNVENRSYARKDNADKGVNKGNYKDIDAMKDYYSELLKIETDAAEAEAQIQQEALDKDFEYMKQDEEIRHKRLVNAENGEYKKQLEEGLLTQKQYNDLMEKENAAYNTRMNALDKEYAAQSLRIAQEGLDAKYNAYNSFYQRTIALVRRKQDDITNELTDANRKADRQSDKNFGFFNAKELGKAYDEAIQKQKDVIAQLNKEMENLDKDNKAGKVVGEEFEQRRTELESALKASIRTLEDYEVESSKIVDKVVAQISHYVQVLGQSIQEIFSAVWDYQDYQFEKEQDELDKWNEELDEKLDEQQEIVERHKDAVNSIEDELSTARGDRRQHLIDQLNAEIQAQREAQAEEKKIQKQKETAAKKQEELEKRRRKEEYDRNVIQAFVSWHMAIANGLATQPFMPLGIAMGALATVLGGVQYALVKSQKPYARGGQLDGGVAQGNRHRDGGIPVLGGRASIEGGEYITNRLTTSKNIDLLDYINSKKKKIDITDLMDFYTSGKPRSIFLNTTRKFEDGGVLPTLRDDIEIPSRLIDTMEDYANRPYVVQVVDIMDKTSQVKQVQAMAGIEG